MKHVPKQPPVPQYPIISHRELHRIKNRLNARKGLVTRNIIDERFYEAAQKLIDAGLDVSSLSADPMTMPREVIEKLILTILLIVYPTGATKQQISDGIHRLMISACFLDLQRLGLAEYKGKRLGERRYGLVVKEHIPIAQNSFPQA